MGFFETAKDKDGAPLRVHWEKIEGSPSGSSGLVRAKVPGGWFVYTMGYPAGLTFYPDPSHEWDEGHPRRQP